MQKKLTRQNIFQEAINLLKSNIISPSDFENSLNWTERKGPWGKTIKNLLLPPEAGDFVTPNKNTFVGQWYWDTMGTNLGLLRSGDDHLKKVAYSMVNNLFYLYETTGLIPNAADSVQITRSQPPFLSTMCLDIGENFFENDVEEKLNWYQKAYEYCKKEVMIPWEVHSSEYGFQWFDKVRELYPGHSPEETLENFRPESRSDFRVLRSVVFKSLSVDLEERKPHEYESNVTLILKALSGLGAEQRKELCDWLYSRRLLVASGMDFTASYGLKPMPENLSEILEPSMLSKSDLVYSNIENISPIDLNCLIYKYYSDLSLMAAKLSESVSIEHRDYYKNEILSWESRRSSLEKLMMNVHYSEQEKCFYNFDMERVEKDKGLPHLTHFAYPLYAGLSDDLTSRELIIKISNLTTKYGVKLTQEKTGYQWDFNMWPLQTWLTYQGLLQYGHEEEAIRIAEGYVRCVEKVYGEKQSFFEKYNAEEGSVNTDGRYPSEPDFSWGAGVYLAFITSRLT